MFLFGTNDVVKKILLLKINSDFFSSVEVSELKYT